MHTPHIHFYLAAMSLPAVGPRTFLRWMAFFSDISAFFQADTHALLTAGIPEHLIPSIQFPNNALIEASMRWADQPQQHLLCLTDPEYPALLKSLIDPPLVLFVRGDPAALQTPQLGMVGSRRATPMGLKTAEFLARQCVEAGLVITSGLARGIDAASHRGALAGRGRTIAVAGTGLSHTYPRAHQGLSDQIVAEGGAIISEFPLSTPPLAANFPRRNRIIAGLSLGVLVVEAEIKSGSLITVRYALENGREVFAVPGSIHNPLTSGCHHLIKQGAILVNGINDILDELALGGRKLSSQLPISQPQAAPLAPGFDAILAHIDYEITSMDVILLRSGLTSGEVSSILLVLELDGYIQSVSGGYVRTILK